MYYTIFVEIIAEHNAVCQGQYQGPEFFGTIHAALWNTKGLKRRYWRQNWRSDVNEAASLSELV